MISDIISINYVQIMQSKHSPTTGYKLQTRQYPKWCVLQYVINLIIIEWTHNRNQEIIPAIYTNLFFFFLIIK